MVAFLLLIADLGPAHAETHFVDLNSTNPVPPYTNWATAAQVIQDAVDASIAGDIILVTNGVYAMGGRAVYGGMTNRVAADQPVVLQSVNGPDATVIQGHQLPGTTNGIGAVRGVYLVNGAVLSGFTITGGGTLASGDLLNEQSGGGIWSESISPVITNCIISGNSAAYHGGGSYSGRLIDCILVGNVAGMNGGGSYYGTLDNCAVVENQAGSDGGGVYYGTLDRCSLEGNIAQSGGGGAAEATLTGCTLLMNSAYLGGGTGGGFLSGCMLTGNSAEFGGGTYAATLDNCTLTGNSAFSRGGGSYFSTANNSILYFNTAGTGSNYYEGTLSYCCTVPAPGFGVTITDDPQLASLSHLSVGSPCVGAGDFFYTSGVDIDGESWLNPPSIGCDEYQVGSVTGLLEVAIAAPLTNVTVGGTLEFTALINGRVSASVWGFGDATVLSNQPYASHSWSAPGSYAVALTAYNETHPTGVSTTLTVNVITQAVYYVSAASTNPVPPFNSWATAAQTIQDAVDAVTTSGALVLVTNGVYAMGGRAVSGQMTNRVAVDKPLRLMSTNGPEVTVIRGYQVPGATNGDQAVRCVYLASGAVLSGFTLTNGATRFIDDGMETVQEEGGGGVLCEAGGSLVTNCILTGNSAHLAGGGCFGQFVDCMFTNNTATFGGGLFSATAKNCTLVDNRAGSQGGGLYDSVLEGCLLVNNLAGYGGGAFGSQDDKAVLNNCTLAGNSATFDSGGAFRCTLRNCILYDNTAATHPNHNGSWLYHCCTTPAPESGFGNITNAPAFANAANDNFRLQPTSPCIDTGINQDWMTDAADLDGTPRILNGTVDMGAYETPFTVDLQVWLQGPYDTNSHAMLDDNSGNIPSTSPYAVDARQALVIPSNVVDWILIKLLDTNGNTLVAKSAFLNTEGEVLSTTGATGITAEVSSGGYSLVVKHRNHLAVMSAQPVAFTNYLTTYDFTPAASQYAGGSNAAVGLEAGVWGMISGDADGDGEILSVDYSIATNQLGSYGYQRADFDLDGVVSSSDLALWTANQQRTAQVTDAETPLLPALIVAPERKSLLPGGPLTLTVSGNVGPANWAMVKAPSGATVTSLTATSALYQAGTTSNQVDVVQAWDSDGRLGRAYVNVISPDEVAKAGKAIVIAGRRNADDALWPVTDYLGNLAYNTLLYRGYSKDNMRYLSPEPDQDVDGNGLPDDIGGSTTLTNVANTLTNWATNPDRMFIYLVDHGGSDSGEGYFRLNESETLTAPQLDAWLDAIQNQYSNDVVVMIDCCESGRFLAPLSHSGPGTRTVITSCATNEPTYFVAGGLVSFSDTFFSGILLGLDLADSFLLARDAMSPYQHSWIDTDGNGFYDAEADPPLVAGIYLGPSFVAGKDIPQIGHVMGNQLLYGKSQAILWAYDVVSAYPLEEVWCQVVPPGHSPNSTNPVADLPKLQLSYQPNSGRYEANYSGFTQVGTYELVYYARDIWGSVSLPRQSFVTQNAFDERVILLAGGSTNDARWSAVNSLSQLAYTTFLGRRLDKTNIYYLNPLLPQDVDADGTNDVDALPTLANLAGAITNWTGVANKLTVYLIGQATGGLFRMNEIEYLSATNLNALLDVYQSSNTEVSVVLDFPGSGAFVSHLKPRPGNTRVTIASTGADRDCLFANEGIVSFSQYFLAEVLDGQNMRSAFEHSRDLVSRASGPLRQHASLDDNGDGSSDASDGDFANQRHIGTAFLTGAERPAVGTEMPNIILWGTNASLVWLTEVTDINGISNVWCVVTPPDYAGGDLPQTPLSWNEAASRYEALYTDFTQQGTYVCTFYAQNKAGEISSSRQADVVVSFASGEDGRALASTFQVGRTELMTLDSPLEEDWVKFYAITGLVFNIEAKQLGANSDLRLDLYHEQAYGTLMFVGSADKYGQGVGFTETLTLDLKTGNSGLSPGLYYVRVSSADTNLFGAGSEYELRIHVPIGGGGGVPFPPGYADLGGLREGFFYVVLEPPQAVAAGAGWRLFADTPYTNDTSVYKLPEPDEGYYDLSFRAVPGFQTPTNLPLFIQSESTTNATVYYISTNTASVATDLLRTSDRFLMTFLARYGTQQAVEWSTNLIDWVPIITNDVPEDGQIHFTNMTAQPRAFFRTRSIP